MKTINSNEINAFDAKTHFSQLIKQVQEGKVFTILKHNHPVAVLSSFAKKTDNISKTIYDLQNFSKGKKLLDMTLEDLIKEGRK